MFDCYTNHAFNADDNCDSMYHTKLTIVICYLMMTELTSSTLTKSSTFSPFLNFFRDTWASSFWSSRITIELNDHNHDREGSPLATIGILLLVHYWTIYKCDHPNHKKCSPLASPHAMPQWGCLSTGSPDVLLWIQFFLASFCQRYFKIEAKPILKHQHKDKH